MISGSTVAIFRIPNSPARTMPLSGSRREWNYSFTSLMLAGQTLCELMRDDHVVVQLAFGVLSLYPVWTCNLYCAALLSLAADLYFGRGGSETPEPKPDFCIFHVKAGSHRMTQKIFFFCLFLNKDNYLPLGWKLAMAIKGSVTFGSIWLAFQCPPLPSGCWPGRALCFGPFCFGPFSALSLHH